MSKVLNLRKFKIKKSIIAGVALGFIFTVAGIKASDYVINFNKNKELTRDVCPQNMVYVSDEFGGFCFDKYEVSPSTDCPYSSPSNQTETTANINSSLCKPESNSGKIPWRYISQTQAATACAKAGKRLPTSEEWYLASLGTPDKDSDWSDGDCQLASNWANQPGMTGHGSNCQSSVGAFDMIGNVWEWVKGEIQDGNYKGKKMPYEGYVISVDSSGMPNETDARADKNFNNDYIWIKNKGARAIARGGYWDNKVDGGIYSLYLVSESSYVGSGVGFRCIK